jgi:uncharacterized RDD family membrane protein YckC
LDTYPLTTAAAPAFETLQGGNPASTNAVVSAPETNYQPSLFRDAQGPKVIPIPTLASSRELQRDAPPRRAPRSATPRTNPRRTSESHRDSQQRLDFEVASPLDTQVEAVISCDAPVALPTHRMIAAAVDASMVLLALAVCFGIFLVGGGSAAFSRQNLPYFAGVGVGLLVLYRLLWCLGNGDSPGLRFAGLRVVDFDGRPPTRDQRALRQMSSLLSLLSAGLGLVWALVDEENLTWHDHISKTFPTPG